MLYKPNLEETIQRHRAFWNRQMPDRILCRINVREGDTGAGEETFMDHIPDIEKMYLDFEHWVKAKRKLEDDSFPIVCPNFGVGMWSSLMAMLLISTVAEGKVKFCKVAKSKKRRLNL